MKQEFERTLGASEEMWWRLDSVQPLNFVMVSRISGKMSLLFLHKALQAVQGRHPKLRMTIEGDRRQRPRFRLCNETIPLTVIDAPQDEVFRYVDSECQKVFDTAKNPLMRCVLIRHEEILSTLLLCIHHSIGDGISGAFLMRDVVHAAGLAAKDIEINLEPLPMLEYHQNRLPPLAKGFRGFINHVLITFSLIFSMFRKGIPRFLHINKKVPVKNRKLYSFGFEFNSSLTDRLTSRTKKEGTTVFGAMAAAMLLAYLDIEKKESISVALGNAVDARNKVDPPINPEELGFCIGAVATIYKVKNDTHFWDLARQIKTELTLNISRHMHWLLMLVPYRLYAFLGRIMGHSRVELYVNILDLIHPPGIMLSNIGCFNYETQHGHLKIENLSFMANPSVLTNLGSTAATLNGCLTWNFGLYEPLLDRKLIEAFANNAIQKLKQAIDYESEEPIEQDCAA